MPRFFFHLYDDVVARDDEGIDLADAEAAKRRAVKEARALACAQVLTGHLTLHHRIDIEDEDGGCVGSVRFEDAVTLER